MRLVAFAVLVVLWITAMVLLMTASGHTTGFIVSPSSPGPSFTIPRNEPSENAERKMYRNLRFGFSLIYPNDPHVFHSENDNALILPSYNISLEINTREEFEASMRRPFPKSPKELTPVANIPSLTNRRTVLIAGEEALRAEAVGGGDPTQDQEVVIFVHKSAIYQFYFDRLAATRKHNLQEDREVFEKILSSFAFLDGN